MFLLNQRHTLSVSGHAGCLVPTLHTVSSIHCATWSYDRCKCAVVKNTGRGSFGTIHIVHNMDKYQTFRKFLVSPILQMKRGVKLSIVKDANMVFFLCMIQNSGDQSLHMTHSEIKPSFESHTVIKVLSLSEITKK